MTEIRVTIRACGGFNAGLYEAIIDNRKTGLLTKSELMREIDRALAVERALTKTASPEHPDDVKKTSMFPMAPGGRIYSDDE